MNRHCAAILKAAQPLALHNHKLPNGAVDLSVTTLVEFARQTLPDGRWTADDIDHIRRRWPLLITYGYIAEPLPKGIKLPG